MSDDEFDLVLEIDLAVDQCGFLMYANDVGYPIGREFFNAHQELFVVCQVADRDPRTGWDALRFATREPPTPETMMDIASRIVEPDANVRVGLYLDGELYRPRPIR